MIWKYRDGCVSNRGIFLVTAGLILYAIPSWGMSMRESAELAVKSYPEVMAAVEYGKSLDQKVQQAFSGYLPRVDFTAGYGRERSDNTTTRASANRSGHWLELDRGETGVLIKQNLFDGFDTSSKVGQAKAQLQVAQARISLTSDNIALQAVQSYAELVLKHIQLEMIKENVLLHQRILSQVKSKHEGGAGALADVHQAKSRTFLASANHASNQSAYKNAQAKFTEIIGVSPLTEKEMERPQVPESLLPKSVEEALDAAVKGNPELEAARLAVIAAESAVASAKSGMMPKVDVELSATNNANVSGVEGHSQSMAAMLRLNYNIFSGGADQARIAEQRNLMEQLRQNLDKTQRALEENTRESWNKLTMAQTRIGFMRQHYEVSKQVTASYHDQFKMGKRTLLDVLNSENELFAAKNGFLAEELNYIKSAYELFVRMGVMQEALQAELPPVPDQLIDKDIWKIASNQMRGNELPEERGLAKSSSSGHRETSHQEPIVATSDEQYAESYHTPLKIVADHVVTVAERGTTGLQEHHEFADFPETLSVSDVISQLVEEQGMVVLQSDEDVQAVDNQPDAKPVASSISSSVAHSSSW
ncbi:MAG: TolC family outer membrane protein [Magnetococcales bacterium]|nr:TolC family outer membrane protein [Magnetococcales bacterium]